MAQKKIITGGGTHPDGVQVGETAAEKVGFFGKDPIVQPTAVAAPAGGATVDAEARTAINAIITKLETLGIVAEN